MKILIIEDEFSLQTVLHDRLMAEGYDVRDALDGVEGMRMIQQWNPHAVVLDMILPRMDGFTVLEELRANKRTALLPVLVLTNLADDLNLDRIRTLLGDRGAYMQKSQTTMNEIVQKLHELIPQNVVSAEDII